VCIYGTICFTSPEFAGDVVSASYLKPHVMDFLPFFPCDFVNLIIRIKTGVRRLKNIA